MAGFHNWTGDELIDTQVPQFLNEDNTATQEKLDTKFNKSLDIAEASDLNNFKDEGFYCCNSNSQAETILNCPTNYAFGLMVWGKGTIVYQEVREYNRSSKNQKRNNCWRRSYYFDTEVQDTWSSWQKVAYISTTLEGYGITDGMRKNFPNSVSVTDIMRRDINTSYLRLMGGTAVVNGAALQLCGAAYTGDVADAGQFSLSAMDSTHSAVLLGNPSGLLRWNDKNIVRSVNNSAADGDGNVTITVDDALSATSVNPIQNKAVKTGMDTLFESVMNRLAVVRDNIPTKVSSLENDAGYLTQHQPLDDYAKKNTANTWSAQQVFYDLMLNREKYTTYAVIGTSDTPIISTGVYNVTGAFTLNLATLTKVLSANQSSVFTAYFAANADYSLTISNAGKLKYVGSASDVAITSAGLLLNIWMSKDGSGTLTSIVQASKLS